jgi:hypothetical protein
MCGGGLQWGGGCDVCDSSRATRPCLVRSVPHPVACLVLVPWHPQPSGRCTLGSVGTCLPVRMPPSPPLPSHKCIAVSSHPNASTRAALRPAMEGDPSDLASVPDGALVTPDRVPQGALWATPTTSAPKAPAAPQQPARVTPGPGFAAPAPVPMAPAPVHNVHVRCEARARC